MTKFVTTRDITIPAGTILFPPPVKSTRWPKDHEASLPVDADHTAYLTMDAQEGVDAGFLRAITQPIKPKRNCRLCGGTGYVTASKWDRACDCLLNQVEPRK